ncbi:MAG TPA: hypothetical protein VL485_22910 [Ktedonobacteraceae bacterium]|nr:hypothetical protein [Ktedonobacteraceae bacterium]
MSTYREIVALLHDPRVSSDLRNRTEPVTPLTGEAADAEQGEIQHQQLPSSFLILDPPEHDRLRRLATRQFGPPHRPDLVNSMRPNLVKIVNGLIDQFQNQHQIDIVASFTYPFPVTVICELLGVPRQDEARFHSWAEAIVNGLNANQQVDREALVRKSTQAHQELAHYMATLLETHRKQPGNDMLSGLVTDTGPNGRMS